MFNQCSTNNRQGLLIVGGSFLATPTMTRSLFIGFSSKPLVFEGFCAFCVLPRFVFYHYLTPNVQPMFDQKNNEYF